MRHKHIEEIANNHLSLNLYFKGAVKPDKVGKKVDLKNYRIQNIWVISERFKR